MTTQETIKKWDNFSKFHILNSVNHLATLLKDKKDIVVVDVGANSGTFFDTLSERLDIKRAILFEPHPELFLYLKSKYEHDKRITVENIALSDAAKSYSLDETSFKWNVELNSDTDTFNLGLSKVNYDINSNLKTDSFDNLRRKYNLEKIDLIKIDTETEDLFVLKGFTETVKELKDKPVIELENNWWERYTYEESKKLLDDFCNINKYENTIDLNVRGDFYLYPERAVTNKQNTRVTIVTGLWDLKRGDLTGWAQRDFQRYKDRFFELLEADVPMCVWIPRELEQEVLAIRGTKPTQLYFKELQDFKTWFPFFNKLQEIRTDPTWQNSAGWLPESPQAALEFYNPMMMCKMFMVNDSAIMNPFGSDYFYWIDGGLTSTVGQGYFTHDKVFDKLESYTDTQQKLTFITYPYEGNTEIHGFERRRMAECCSVDFVNKISRGGFWGGTKEQIHQLNTLYYSVLQDTLIDGYMGADECLFTILTYRHPELIKPFEIEGNGLVWPFFEMLKNFEKPEDVKKPFSKLKTSLYVVGYNSPTQFEALLQSFEKADRTFLDKPRKILINNSLDRSTDNEYSRLCQQYGFEEIKKDNIGICGGRQFAAEHFNESDSDYYVFFEDDMLLHEEKTTHCHNGFRNYTESLYERTLRIIYKEEYDYLKLSFTEVYGDNGTQWSWYNVPQNIREQFFPQKTKLPIHGLDPNAPKTEFKIIKNLGGISYLEGDVHYCNWPLWFGRKGNQKVFLDVTWQRPMEQTWMSNVFQLQKAGKINAAILLLSPINHNRVFYYPGQERREN